MQLTRKVYALTDPKTGEVLTEYKGKVVEGIAFPYQVFTYWLENGRIRATAEYGIEPNLIKTTSVNGLGWRSMGADTLVVNAPVFVNHTMPNGKHIESWESYDFFLHAPGTVAEPYQLTFVAYHDLLRISRHVGPGFHVMAGRHFTACRATVSPHAGPP